MTLTRYGTDTAITVLVFALVIIVGGLFISNIPLKVLFILLGAAIAVFTLNFFRDPERATPADPDAVIAPADGKIVSIGRVEETEVFHGKATQVCIFMSPLNVHVNRYPITGRVDYFRYIPGRYLVAFAEKSSDVNERTLIGITNGSQRVLFKQIAGFLARRIVCPVKVGDSAVAGQRFGMIKFGSRVDVLLPEDVEVAVSLNQQVVAGETILARFPARRDARATEARQE